MYVAIYEHQPEPKVIKHVESSIHWHKLIDLAGLIRKMIPYFN